MVCNQNICYNRIVKDRSGFTLTELLIIVAIVGILAITAVIPILETRALRLDAAAQPVEVVGTQRIGTLSCRRTGRLQA